MFYETFCSSLYGRIYRITSCERPLLSRVTASDKTVFLQLTIYHYRHPNAMAPKLVEACNRNDWSIDKVTIGVSRLAVVTARNPEFQKAEPDRGKVNRYQFYQIC